MLGVGQTTNTEFVGIWLNSIVAMAQTPKPQNPISKLNRLLKTETILIKLRYDRYK